MGGMPFKSQAQRRKFAELLVKGEISNDTFEEWNRETGGKALPERVNQKKKGGKLQRTAKSAKRKTAGAKPKRKTQKAKRKGARKA
jgi:hypothetical protein